MSDDEMGWSREELCRVFGVPEKELDLVVDGLKVFDELRAARVRWLLQAILGVKETR